MRVLVLSCLLVAFPAAFPAAAQTIFKCSDGRSVTYSNTACDKLGLKLTGEVEDRVSSLPSPPLPASPAKKPPTASPLKEADAPKSVGGRASNPMVDVLRK